MLLWLCEGLVVLRARLERAGVVVSWEAGVLTVLCAEFWEGLGCGYLGEFLGSVGRLEIVLVKALASSMVCLACHRRRRRCQMSQTKKTMTSRMNMSTSQTRISSRTKKNQ